MCRLAAVHAPPSEFWENPENTNKTRICRFFAVQA